jgi:uncharacterized membrane protein YagU involved in acid resistance
MKNLKRFNYFSVIFALGFALTLSQFFDRTSLGHALCWVIFLCLVPCAVIAGVRMSEQK